ncbi:MAG: hypothetical protein JNL85_05650 [Rubrivivax sp.]|nr:hypothetical protein [Rubrivivax sp.]
MAWLVAEILIALALAVVLVGWTMAGRRRGDVGARRHGDGSDGSGTGDAGGDEGVRGDSGRSADVSGPRR